MGKVTKQHAEAIAKKLRAVRHEKLNRPHDLCLVYHEGRLVARFGIRRGSKKNAGHDHIPGDIHLGPHAAVRLAECNMTRDAWLRVLHEKRIIATEPPPEVDAEAQENT
jgi:hypothetical protein